MDLEAKHIKDMIYRGMANKPANPWPLYKTGESLDRTKYVTASEVGYCERKVYLDKQELRASGYSPEKGTASPSTGWGFFERGHNVEAWFIDTITRGLGGAKLLFAGQFQVSFANKYQSGTPDGAFILENDTAFKTLEVKSIDPRTSAANLPKPEHIDQVTQNCDLVEQALDKDCHGSLLVYVNASDYEDIRPFEIPFGHERAARLEAKAERIMRATGPADLEPEGVHKGHCGYCRHTTVCNALVRKPVMEKTTNDIKLAAARIFAKSGQLQAAPEREGGA